MMHNNPSLPGSLSFSEFNFKMSGGILVHFKLNMLKLKINDDEYKELSYNLLKKKLLVCKLD